MPTIFWQDTLPQNLLPLSFALWSFDVWDIDVSDLENRHKKLKALEIQIITKYDIAQLCVFWYNGLSLPRCPKTL